MLAVLLAILEEEMPTNYIQTMFKMSWAIKQDSLLVLLEAVQMFQEFILPFHQLQQSKHIVMAVWLLVKATEI